MKSRTKLVSGLALLSLLVLLPAAPTFASEPGGDPVPPPPGDIGSSVLTTGGSETGPVTDSLDMGVSPSGCAGQTDYAHKSTLTNESSVHGKTTCTFPAGELGVTTYLFNLAWFGWNLLDSRSIVHTNSTNTGDATPHYGCSSPDPHDFYGASNHYSIEGGTEYVASTTSPVQTFVC